MGLRHRIVRIVSTNTLVTPDLTESLYTTGNHQPLKPGIYTVVWPSNIRKPIYNSDAKYIGPFKTVAYARLLVRLCVAEYFLEKRFITGAVQRLEPSLH